MCFAKRLNAPPAEPHHRNVDHGTRITSTKDNFFCCRSLGFQLTLTLLANILKAVLWIPVRKFLGLPDPDPS
jgi:hypothetical protein